MRKVLSWALTLAMVLTSFSVAFAATYSDTSGTACADAVGVLSELGVVNGYEDGTYKPSQVVTRAEASKLIVSALGLTSYASGSKSSFTDLSGYEWASGYIGYAQSLGVLKGDGNGKFRPGDTVTYNEMATIIARALGFTDASLQGTWPANYVSKAKTLGIMDDITGGGGATGANRGDVAIMIYNALSLEIGYINNDNQWVTTYSQSGTHDTMLIRLKASEYNGGEPFVVTYNKAKDAATNLMKYVGAYVTAYQNKDNDIMAVKEVKSTFLKGKMSNGKFKADADDTEYTISGADFDVASTKGAVIIKNAEATTQYAIDASDLGTGTVTLSAKISGTTIKEVYAVMTWKAQTTDFFAADDATDISSDNELFGADFYEDDNSKIDTTMFALNGVTSLSAIQKDNVVQVYQLGESSSADIVRVDVGTQVVSGEVTSIKAGSATDYTDYKYTISGTQYKFNTDQDTATIRPDSGDEVKAFLTFGGKVFKFEKLSGASNYAVVINRGTSGTMDGTGQIKLILADGTVKTYNLDDDVDDAIFDDGWKAAANSTESGVTVGSIIKYNINKAGDIDDITTCKAIVGTGTTISAKGYYDSCALASDVSIFSYSSETYSWPTFSTKSDDYTVSTRAKVLDVDNVKAYYVTNTSGDIIAMLMNDAQSDKNVFGVATSWEKDNSDAGYAIQLLVNGTKTDKYSAKSTAYSTVNNDNGKSLYKVTFDASGNVQLTTNLGHLNGPSSDDDAYNMTTYSAVSCAAIGSSKVYSDAAKTNKIATLDSDVVVYVWNVTDKVFEKGSVNDIKSSDYDGDRYFYATDNDNLDVYDIVLVYDNN